VTIVLARDLLGAAADVAPPEWPNPSQLRWLAPKRYPW